MGAVGMKKEQRRMNKIIHYNSMLSGGKTMEKCVRDMHFWVVENCARTKLPRLLSAQRTDGAAFCLRYSGKLGSAW